MNTLTSLTIIAILVIVVVILIFFLLRKDNCPESPCCRNGCNCEKEALKKLFEHGVLAQKIVDAERVHEMDEVKIDVLLQEIHSLIFFCYFKPGFETRFKKELENRLQCYRRQAEENDLCYDEKLATAIVYEQLLRKLSMTWNEETKQV